MAGAGWTGHGVRAEGADSSPQGLRLAQPCGTLCGGGRALRRGTCPRRTATSFAPGAASEPRPTRARPFAGDADTNSVRAVPTTAARNAARPFTVSRVLARDWPACFVLAAAYHACNARTRHADSLRRRAPLRKALPVHRRRARSSIRGEPFFFPAPLGPPVQSPVWLLSSMTDASTGREGSSTRP